MNQEQPKQPTVVEPEILAYSLGMRIALRVLICVALVVAVFSFLFFPPATRFATYPIPVAIVLFAVLSGFERTIRGFLRWWYRKKKSHIVNAQGRSGTSFMLAVVKAMAALLLAAVMIAATIYSIPALGIAAAVILLVATVIESPQLGFFTTSSEIDKTARLRRQTLDSLADVFPDDRFEMKNAARDREEREQVVEAEDEEHANSGSHH